MILEEDRQSFIDGFTKSYKENLENNSDENIPMPSLRQMNNLACNLLDDPDINDTVIEAMYMYGDPYSFGMMTSQNIFDGLIHSGKEFNSENKH